MNNFFDSLKEIKKDMVKEQKSAQPKTITKEDVIAKKEKKLRDDFLAYIKDCNIKKI
ncbi:hypothetical protein CPIN17260_0612 [Campylobacter pinnipediorum subsp. pinnipediorum]|uniref:hypothetical protein n=1 Tax=Campylobacter pinnipediorum TaxID=1965231 RepID=UPI0009C30381|nr:hypothetical protein [Campylobacter pinnipediorum]AQW80925.1 hypothetical protein CPIN17260_0612 [Campylobacter pinnipediorum subsp. pinnipediorum]AQW84228.1 hypothetical protein CPIN17262_0531 [Campylobacter pinnipediorum subsp. pinnipediorum]